MMTKFKIEFESKWYDAVELKVPDGAGCYETLVFADEKLYDELFYNPDIDEFKSKDAELLFDNIEFFTKQAHNAESEAEFINAVCDENSDYKEMFNDNEVRRCSVCGKVLQTGFTDEEGFYACSEECLEESYSTTGGMAQYDEDYENGRCYYTEWDTPFFND